MRLENKVAIITGGASGFGAEMTRQYVREGAKVIIADVNEAGAQSLAGELGDAAHGIRADVTDAADVQAMVDAAQQTFGSLDVLINNAGYTHVNQPMLDVDEATYDRIFAVNVKAIFLAATVAVPVLRATGGGVILTIASTAGIRPRPGLVWYNASKGAAIMMSQAMAVELAPDNIRVNAICPVASETPMLDRFMGGDTPELRAKFTASVPLGRLGAPEDVASAAIYLASDEAKFLTGLALPVDGGRCVW